MYAEADGVRSQIAAVLRKERNMFKIEEFNPEAEAKTLKLSNKLFHEALKELPCEIYGKIMFAINEYALFGTEPNLTGMEKSLFTLIKPQIDANNRRRENGVKGGAPSVNQNARKQPIVMENTVENNRTEDDWDKDVCENNQKQPKTTKNNLM